MCGVFARAFAFAINVYKLVLWSRFGKPTETIWAILRGGAQRDITGILGSKRLGDTKAIIFG